MISDVIKTLRKEISTLAPKGDPKYFGDEALYRKRLIKEILKLLEKHEERAHLPSKAIKIPDTKVARGSSPDRTPVKKVVRGKKISAKSRNS